MRAAAEAVKEALVLDHVKRRGLFVVKRAEAGIFATLASQPHPPADQFAQRDPGAQVVEKARRKGHPNAALFARFPFSSWPGLTRPSM